MPMHLMRSAPPMSSRRTRSRTSSGVVTTPNRRSAGSSMSCASPTTSPPPHGAVMNAPAHCIRGPSSSPALIVSRSAQSTNARNVPRSRTVVKPGLERDARVPHAQQRVLRGGCRRGGDARGLDLADEVAVGVDEPGQDGEVAEVDDRARRPARHRPGARPPRRGRRARGACAGRAARRTRRPAAGRRGWPGVRTRRRRGRGSSSADRMPGSFACAPGTHTMGP